MERWTWALLSSEGVGFLSAATGGLVECLACSDGAVTGCRVFFSTLYLAAPSFESNWAERVSWEEEEGGGGGAGSMTRAEREGG